jgi:nicotinamidase/pyrazinamidase
MTDLSKTALVVVDVSPTFMPGGELPVPNGDAIIEPLLALLRARGHEFGLVVFSRDWHPHDHCSFTEHPRFADGSWPAHGLAETENARTHPQLLALCQELKLPYIIISKGMDVSKEAYSAFDFAAADLSSGKCLDDILIEHAISRVFVCGLAGEVCVLASALAARELGYQVTLLAEATGYLGDPTVALTSMRAHGIIIDTSLRLI